MVGVIHSMSTSVPAYGLLGVPQEAIHVFLEYCEAARFDGGECVEVSRGRGEGDALVTNSHMQVARESLLIIPT